MKSETLSLLNPLDKIAATNVTSALTNVNGVRKVSVDAASVEVEFDEDVTSIQELRATLQRAGVSVKKAAHAEGMCCGSCGG